MTLKKSLQIFKMLLIIKSRMKILYNSKKSFEKYPITSQAKKTFKDCCGKRFACNEDVQNSRSSSYTSILSRGGLLILREDLSEVNSKSFVLLDASSTTIKK